MEHVPYTLGLDIGIASVGYAVLQNDESKEPIRILDLGVRVFEQAENPKDGVSLAAPRREARGIRRRLRRKRHRKERIRFLIESFGLMAQAEMAEMFERSGFQEDVYALRVKALDSQLTRQELVRLLIHFAQRRGFKSNSKSQDAKDAESGKLKKAISANQEVMATMGYRTVGEMLLKDPRFAVVNADGTVTRKVHNTPGEYMLTLSRSEILEEVTRVLDKQASFPHPLIGRDFIQKYLDILFGQRNFDEGPGGDSPYGGNQIESMVKSCKLEPQHKVAAKASFTFEYFRLLQELSHLRLVRKDGLSLPLTAGQRERIREKAMKTSGLSFGQLRKALDIPPDTTFNCLYYGNQSIEEQEKKKFGHMRSYHEIRTALNRVRKGAVDAMPRQMVDRIATILSLYKSDSKRIQQLKAADVPELYFEALLGLSFSKFGNLSIAAMEKIIPFLEQGMDYKSAEKAAYPKAEGLVSAKPTLGECLDGITNPVVRRAVSQTFKVIRAVICRYGSPELIRIELSRELAKPKKERDQMAKRQQDNRSQNENAKNLAAEYKAGKVTGQDIVKFKLFQEQDGLCLYSGKNLDIRRLFEPGYADIDHIIPYSLSFDDSYSNKVLVLSAENRRKGNRIPYEYFGADALGWRQFEVRVNARIRSMKKRNNLLLTQLTPDRLDGFKTRNLVDTQYLSREVYRLVSEFVDFSDPALKRPVQTVNGAITAYVRKRLGLDKHRGNGDLHHAQDAAVIASISPGMIQKITRYSQLRERAGSYCHLYTDPETGKLLTRADYDKKYAPPFEGAWPRFREELIARMDADPQTCIDRLHLATYDSGEEINPIFVSHMPNHKVTGAAHDATVRSSKKPGFSVSKTPLTKLRLDKTGTAIDGYYNRESDRLLHDALVARLKQFGADAQKAFAAPFHKPKRDGTPGPVVKSVKIESRSSSSVSVLQGTGQANNSSMVRLDIFHVENDGYYAVPIYVADTMNAQLPSLAVVSGKDWKPMEASDFLFSLYPGDLVYLKRAKAMEFKAAKGSDLQPTVQRKEGAFYFRGFDISTASITVAFHDRSYSARSIGIKTLADFRKYQVDILGGHNLVALPEKRQGFR